MRQETQEQIKKGIELHQTLANTITKEQKELIQKIIDNDVQTMKMHFENYEESGNMFELYLACGYLGGIGANDWLLHNINDSNNKEYKAIFSKLSDVICGTRR